MKEISIVIPSLNPDEKLIGVVEDALRAGFEDIILVNDGSRSGCLSYFDACALYPEVTVLTHPVNRGKGAAIKTAIDYVMHNRPASLGIVTADGDGQHHGEDIRALAEHLVAHPDRVVLGVRDFSAPDVPPRSRFGNRLTSFIFLTGVGLRIRDTQTGLRALPASRYALFAQTKGDRYEYETNMLLDMKQHDIPFDQVTIRTIYIDENQTSHFHPIRDSVRIYAQILKFCAGSLLGALVDYVAFLIISALTLRMLSPTMRILIATVAARILSSLVNFTCNRTFAFASGGRVLPSMLRYYCLAVPQMLVSAGLVRLLSLVLSDSAVFLTSILKLLVDTVLFFASYRIQKKWVFRAD